MALFILMQEQGSTSCLFVCFFEGEVTHHKNYVNLLAQLEIHFNYKYYLRGHNSAVKWKILANFQDFNQLSTEVLFVCFNQV